MAAHLLKRFGEPVQTDLVKRGWQPDKRPAVPGGPCTPKAGATTDAASAPVNGHGHRFGRGVDQPDYASPSGASPR